MCIYIAKVRVYKEHSMKDFLCLSAYYIHNIWSCCVQVFMEQKKMLKTGLSMAHFRRYVPLIEQETVNYFQRWGDTGEKGTTFFTFFTFCLSVHPLLPPNF